nr:proline-rich receptor-like protein kinase PERK2 [Bactrocera oleae]
MQFITHMPLLLALSTTVSYASSSTYDGKPGCKTPGEIGNAYRNFWDPMRYWRCIGLDMEPLRESCPDVTAFQQSLGRCVPWRYWKWEVPVYPPSCPSGVMCIQTESKPSSLYSQELYPQAPPQALVPISPLYPQAMPQPIVPITPPQALVPTSPISQPQPSTKPHILGPLPPQPSGSPQIVHSPLPSPPFVPPQSPQVFSPPFVSSPSHQILNTPYPMIPSRPQYPSGLNV